MHSKFYQKINVSALISYQTVKKLQDQHVRGSLASLLFVLLFCTIGLGQTVTTYDRSAWTVIANSAEPADPDGNGPASKLIDGNNTTYWASQRNPIQAPFPHTLVFDMQVIQPVNQIYYLPTIDQDYDPSKGSLAFSDNGTDFGPEIPISFILNPVKTTIILPTVQNHRFFRITMTENRVTRDFPEDHNTITRLEEVGANYDSNFSTLLSSFKATSTDLGVKLDWTTDVEPGTGTYVITRSVDGLNNFTPVGLSIAVSASNSPTTYSFTDLFPVNGTSFYRLELTGNLPPVPVQKSRPTFAQFPLVTYGSDKPKNLNIFYFIPSDLAAPDDFKHRMDDIMLGLQTYFKDELIRNGRSNSTFGMFTDDATHSKVQLHVINGKFPKSSYGEEHAEAILTEVNAYVAANPINKSGEHNLIMLPAYSINYNTSPTGNDPDGIFLQGPFFGSGKNCFAMDYDQMKYSNIQPDKQDTKDGRNSVKFIGGLAHELAHGLNVPHNERKVSETALGTTLMSSGNYTFGASTTSLTAADAAILNNNQIFNNGNISYYGPIKASISLISACYNDIKKSIIITGTVTTNGSPVTDVSIYNDPDKGVAAGMGDNKDYDAVTWTTSVTNSITVAGVTTARFYIEEPIDELQVKSNSLYEMKLNLIQLDGNTSFFKYGYNFPADVPEISYTPYTAGVTGPTLTPVSFSIQATAGTNGTILPTGTTAVSCVEDQTFTITPAAGFVIDKVLIDGIEHAVSGGQVLRTSASLPANFTFTSVNTAHTISATFKTDPLPVTLASFDVNVSGTTGAFLKWETTAETNNSGFDIEMSTNAKLFDKVGYVEGKGESQVSHLYNYTLSNLSGGLYYFRLKQLDFDGKFEYSTIKALLIRNAEDAVSIYPNPGNGKMKINPGLHKNDAFSIQILNEKGQKVMTLPSGKQYGNGYELDASFLGAGLYYIKLQGGNFVENLKFVKF